MLKNLGNLRQRFKDSVFNFMGRYCDLPDRDLAIHNNIQVNVETKSNLAKH